MITNREVVHYLEKIRIERKITIQAMTEGILSRRNYSRLLSGDAHVSIDILSKMLSKMEIPFNEFSFYIHNHLMYENVDEYNFFEYIFFENYEKAFKEIYPSIKHKECRSLLRNKTIPICIKFLEYKLNIISKSDALSHLTKHIDLDSLLKRYIIQDDDIKALYLYTQLCSDQNKSLIVDFLLKVVFGNDFKMLTAHYEESMIFIYLILLEALTTQDNLLNSNHDLIKNVYQKALEFHSRAKLEVYDVYMFKVLYKYIKKYNIDNPYIIFHYIASIISTLDDNITQKTYEINQSDIEIFSKHINHEHFNKRSMYERLLSNDHI